MRFMHIEPPIDRMLQRPIVPNEFELPWKPTNKFWVHSDDICGDRKEISRRSAPKECHPSIGTGRYADFRVHLARLRSGDVGFALDWANGGVVVGGVMGIGLSRGPPRTG